MIDDPEVIEEIWEMRAHGQASWSCDEIVAGLLRGRQAYSQYDPVWIIAGNIIGHGVVRLGRLRCEGSGRTYATVVLAAYALGEACPPPLAALASRLLSEGRAQPVMTSSAPEAERLCNEAMRLQAEDGFPGPHPVGSAWFRLHGLPPVRWVVTERRVVHHTMRGAGGEAGLVMDGYWEQAVIPVSRSRAEPTRGVLAFTVLLAAHVQHRPDLTALAALILAGGHARFVEQSAEYVQRLVEHQRSYNLQGNTAI